MAKMYYTVEETMSRLGVDENGLRGFVRDGKLREFRDAGKLNYRVDEVERIATGGSHDTTELSLEDSSALPITPGDSGPGGKSGSGSGSAVLNLSGTNLELSDAPIDLGGSGSGALSLGGSTSLRLEDPEEGKGKSGELRLDDSRSGSAGGADVLSLEEVDKDVVKGMKKDDTVITNIGISVFDDEDLEIAADPMAKTLMTGGDEHLGLDGSGGGSGLLDLTRESDDTSLGAELLEGIDLGDTAATVAQTVEAAPPSADSASEAEADLPMEVGAAPVAMVPMAAAGYIEAASPAFTGLLIAATAVMALSGAAVIAMAMNAWPGYLTMLADNFWFFLPGALVLGGIAAGIGYVVGKPRTPRPPRPAKEKVAKEKPVKEKKEKKKK